MVQLRTLDHCVDSALAILNADLRGKFLTDPAGTLQRELKLKVEPAHHLTNSRKGGGACDGMSFLKDGVILYAPTPSSRRQNFTLAHELGHWLVEQVDEIIDWLLTQREPDHALEMLCDRIAQRLLLSEALIESVVGDGPIQARHLRELYDASSASEPVCAIALSSRIRGVGAVIILETATWVVRYASVRPDPERGWPVVYPWRGQVLNKAHALARLAPGAMFRQRSYWDTSWGQREEFYIDAVADHRRKFAVLSDTDIWNVERLHLDTPRKFEQRPELEIWCCGELQVVRGYPCNVCNEPHCPKCGSCRCDRRAATEVMCAGGCFIKYAPHLLVDGLCEECR
jgi:hypothetical protein